MPFFHCLNIPFLRKVLFKWSIDVAICEKLFMVIWINELNLSLFVVSFFGDTDFRSVLFWKLVVYMRIRQL